MSGGEDSCPCCPMIEMLRVPGGIKVPSVVDTRKRRSDEIFQVSGGWYKMKEVDVVNRGGCSEVLMVPGPFAPPAAALVCVRRS